MSSSTFISKLDLFPSLVLVNIIAWQFHLGRCDWKQWKDLGYQGWSHTDRTARPGWSWLLHFNYQTVDHNIIISEGLIILASSKVCSQTCRINGKNNGILSINDLILKLSVAGVLQRLNSSQAGPDWWWLTSCMWGHKAIRVLKRISIVQFETHRTECDLFTT